MALQLYTKGKIFIFNEDGAGGLVAQAVKFSVEFDTQNQPVVTLNDGFSGITPGAGVCKVNIESAIPRTGFEIDWHKWAKDRTMVEITGSRGSSTISVKGFIAKVGEQHGVDGSTSSIDIDCGEPET